MVETDVTAAGNGRILSLREAKNTLRGVSTLVRKREHGCSRRAWAEVTH